MKEQRKEKKERRKKEGRKGGKDHVTRLVRSSIKKKIYREASGPKWILCKLSLFKKIVLSF